MEIQKSVSIVHSIRSKILYGGFLGAICIYALVHVTVSSSELAIMRLQQSYGFIALGLLYLTLLVSPLTVAFPGMQFAGKIKRGRRASGQLVFFFGALHGSIALFLQLGGISGLQFLDATYRLALSLSFIALCILFLMTVTSFDLAVARLTYNRWKILHRFVYLAGMLILCHAWLLGSHFADRLGPIMNVLYVALAFLFSLEAHRFDTYLYEKNIYRGKMRIFFSLSTGIFLAFFLWLSWVHGIALLGESR